MSNVATSPEPPAQPVDQPPPAPVAYAPAPPRRKGGLLLAGLALVVALVAGAAGFAIGHATADGHDHPERVFRQGPDDQRGPLPPGAPER